MPAEPERPTARANRSMHVLLMTRGAVALSYAGPGLTVRRLLKTHGQNDAKAFAMSAVFGDKVANSYESLAPVTGIDQSAKRPPGSLRFSLGFMLSVVRFIFNLTQSMKSIRSKPLILHSHDLVAAYLSSLRYRRRHPLLFTLHGKGGYVREPMLQYPVFRGTFIEKFLRHIEMTAIRRADTVVFTSRGSQALFEGEYPGLLQGKDVRVVYPGLEMQELDSAPVDRALLKKYEVKDGESVLLCVAALVKDKGVDTLIEAIGSLPDAVRSKLSCLVVGRGYLKEELQSLIVKRDLAASVKLLDFMPRDELLGLMKAADLFVLPSRVSVFDQVLLEVGAVGLPVITTAVGGNLEMFDESSAILIPPNDPQALATAILRMLTNDGLRQRLAENARQRIRSRFSPESEFSSYAAIYEEVASRKIDSPCN